MATISAVIGLLILILSLSLRTDTGLIIGFLVLIGGGAVGAFHGSTEIMKNEDQKRTLDKIEALEELIAKTKIDIGLVHIGK